MRNPEVIEFRNRILLSLFLILVISIIIIFFVINRFGGNKSDFLKVLYNDDTALVLLLDSKNCDYCSNVKKILDERNLKYIIYDTYKEQDEDAVFFKLEISQNKILLPALIYVENGKMRYSIDNINDDEIVNNFLDSLSSNIE